MALALKFCVTQSSDCTTISIEETTGAYSASNTGGWGAPNPAIANALTATIKIAKRNTDGTYSTEATVNAFSTLPNITGTKFSFTADSITFGDDFSDGIYRIIYTVTGSVLGVPFTASTTQYKTLDCHIVCCLQKRSDAVSLCSCDCVELTKEFKEISAIKRLLDGAKCCGQLDKIQTYITFLTDVCADCGC